MKRRHVMGSICYVWVLCPLFLTSCELFDESYNKAPPPSYTEYDYQQPSSKSSSPGSNARANANTSSGSSSTSVSQTAGDAMKLPTSVKPASSTDGPSVPSMAPTVSQ